MLKKGKNHNLIYYQRVREILRQRKNELINMFGSNHNGPAEPKSWSNSSQSQDNKQAKGEPLSRFLLKSKHKTCPFISIVESKDSEPQLELER